MAHPPGVPRTTDEQRLAHEQREAWSAASKMLSLAKLAYESRRPLAEVLSAASAAEAAVLFQNAWQSLLGEAVRLHAAERPLRRSLKAIEDFDAAIAGAPARLHGSMQSVLAGAVHLLHVPWLVWLAGDGANSARRWERWTKEVDRIERRATALLAKYDALAGEGAAQSGARHAKRRQRILDYWWRRARSVEGYLEFAGGLGRAGTALLRIAESLAARILGERKDLLAALRAQAEYLADWRGGEFNPPEIKARIASADEWAGEFWNHSMHSIAQLLPESVECYFPRSPLPHWPDPAYILTPQAELRSALQRASLRAGFRGQFYKVTELHLAIAQEIERSSEVVSYAAQASSASGTDLIGEAIANVAARLAEREAMSRSSSINLSRPAIPIILNALLETATQAETARPMRIASSLRRRAEGWLAKGRAGAIVQTESAIATAGLLAVAAYDNLLIKVGWKSPVRAPVPPVITRPDFFQAFQLDVKPRELPALYRRLFRLAPVDDPRFLIGREEELAGFREALSAWHAGQYAAVLLVGARGSGKSSLLNCALPTVFQHENVVRAQFSARIGSPADMDWFLSNALGCPEPSHLPDYLATNRRVIILEEVERSYIRTFGGFDAPRRLLEIVDLSAPTTLWVLVLNLASAAMLDYAIGLRSYFSHTINAMSVWRDDLARAILQRHNLSGLKLAFAPPADSRLRVRLGGRTDPQQAFFDSLYEQSGGNFRSAFQLWLSAVDRVEGGTIHMRQPLAPNLASLRKHLAQQDHFTLLAILQHGSLTPAELALVMAEPESSSRLRLDRLSSLGLVEPDPEHPGLRIDPEALRFVNTLLQSVNLV